MKTLICLLALGAVGLAAEAPYAPPATKTQSALLLLPLKEVQNNSTNSTTTPRPSIDNEDNLDEVSARIMERLRQEEGSRRGEFHVYLEDGRLQRVQYTTAPLRDQQQPQVAEYERQVPDILSPEQADRRSVYFVQVPIGKAQDLRAPRLQEVVQEPNPVNVRYLPLEYYRASADAAPGEYSRQQPYYPTAPADQLTSLRYSQVEPIRGPVYSYTPQQLTRILRYAPAL